MIQRNDTLDDNSIDFQDKRARAQVAYFGLPRELVPIGNAEPVVLQRIEDAEQITPGCPGRRILYQIVFFRSYPESLEKRRDFHIVDNRITLLW